MSKHYRVQILPEVLPPELSDSSRDAAARFLEALADIRDQHHSGTAVVVAHGGVTTDALRTLLGDDELLALAPSLIEDGVPCGAITTLHGSDHQWSVESIATTAHLP